ncbi:hypothetical protein BOTBODRAFT_117862 [Botryobasidium botryosum FD-172 SS1]|uniref:Pantoate--beta-alanine ligase n=1 Tax=Botryobasidium botryosum (strain FD-172 SS1) TaxID=930990 RepID=A0A067M095_BOTB1|nr:hypothetical protein BOTBODRAFT_117862 [Botryobasidium botryosum FD-172 SS1]
MAAPGSHATATVPAPSAGQPSPGLADLPAAPFPIFTTVDAYREWRRKAMVEGKSVGFVPTMGALHDGHMSLVRHSLLQNDLTVLSIFVNPAQFAQNEDLATYPRTLEADLTRMASLALPSPASPAGDALRSVSALFLPTVKEMYPSGIVQNVDEQRGTFIDVKGYGHQMEGQSRPTFFRGVATVVTKLFNAIEPTHAYFGQKDIQQALLLRRLVQDLLLSHPTPQNLHIVPTLRSSSDGLALSSRNVYLTAPERDVAGVLYAALKRGEEVWKAGGGRDGAVRNATEFVESCARDAEAKGVHVKLDYIEMNDPETFEIVDWDTRLEDGRPVILSGAVWVGKTRLIDNILLGDASRLLM